MPVSATDFKQLIDWITSGTSPLYDFAVNASLYRYLPGTQTEDTSFDYVGLVSYLKPKNVGDKTGIKTVPGDWIGALPAFYFQGQPNAAPTAIMSIMLGNPVTMSITVVGGSLNGTTMSTNAIDLNLSSRPADFLVLNFTDGQFKYEIFMFRTFFRKRGIVPLAAHAA